MPLGDCLAAKGPTSRLKDRTGRAGPPLVGSTACPPPSAAAHLRAHPPGPGPGRGGELRLQEDAHRLPLPHTWEPGVGADQEAASPPKAPGERFRRLWTRRQGSPHEVVMCISQDRPASPSSHTKVCRTSGPGAASELLQDLSPREGRGQGAGGVERGKLGKNG